MTVSAWVKPNSLSSAETVLGKFSDGATSGWRMSTTEAAAGSLAFDAASEAAGGDGSTESWPHTVTTGGANRLIVVGVSTADNNVAVSSVTYGGQALALVPNSTVCSLEDCTIRVELWYKVDPLTGPNTVFVTLNSASEHAAGATSYTGVDQTTPLGTAKTQPGHSGFMSLSGVVSATGEIVVDVAAVYSSSAIITAQGGQTERWKDIFERANGGMSTKPGAASVTMEWDIDATKEWAIAAVSIKPAPGSDPDDVLFQFSSDTAKTEGDILANNTWGQWTAVFDGTQTGNANRLKFYFNGVEQSLAFTGTIPATTPDTVHDLRINGTSDNSDFFGGLIDEVRISNIARSADWIQTEYNNQSDPANFHSVCSEETPSSSVTTTSITFPGTTINGTDQTIDDNSANNWQVTSDNPAGTDWHVNISSTDFSTGTYTIAVSNFEIRLLDANIEPGSDKPASQITTYTPLSTSNQQLLAYSGSNGNSTFDFIPDFQLDILAETYIGNYSATVTVTYVTGP
jgi:hypothetical protein